MYKVFPQISLPPQKISRLRRANYRRRGIVRLWSAIMFEGGGRKKNLPTPTILSRVLSKKTRMKKKVPCFKDITTTKIATQRPSFLYFKIPIYCIGRASKPAPKNTKSKWLQKTALSPKIWKKYICLFIEFPLKGKSLSIFEFYMHWVDEKASKVLKLVWKILGSKTPMHIVTHHQNLWKTMAISLNIPPS